MRSIVEEERRIRFIVFILVYLFSFSMFHRHHCNNHRKLGTCSCNFSPIYIKEILRNGLPFTLLFWCSYLGMNCFSALLICTRNANFSGSEIMMLSGEKTGKCTHFSIPSETNRGFGNALFRYNKLFYFVILMLIKIGFFFLFLGSPMICFNR